jgi:hypothetical protein
MSAGEMCSFLIVLTKDLRYEIGLAGSRTGGPGYLSLLLFSRERERRQNADMNAGFLFFCGWRKFFVALDL